MNTPTHSLLAMALLSKRGSIKRNWAVFIGSFIPDAIIYIWAPYMMFVKGVDGRTLWDKLYFEAPMQNAIALVNSIPIYSVIAVIGAVLWFKTQMKTAGLLILVFALAALSHIATDLPVHAHDAYRHFWPLSDYRFYSPLSYYEMGHHSGLVSLVEALIAFVSIAVLWRRFPKLWVKCVLTILACLYIGLQVARLVVDFGGST